MEDDLCAVNSSSININSSQWNDSSSEGGSHEGIAHPIELEMCFYVLSLCTAFFLTIVYVLVFKTILRHVTINGVRVTLLKYLCFFDLAHIYLQIVTLYLCTHIEHSDFFLMVRFTLYSTFLISVQLNMMITANQFLYIKHGLHYHQMVANTNVGRNICLHIIVMVILHAVSFVMKLESYFFAVFLSAASIVMCFLNVSILWEASKNAHAASESSSIARMSRGKGKWKKYVTKIFLFIVLSMSIVRTIFSIKHGRSQISYICIKVMLFLACLYLIVTPLIHIWMMTDIKKFFIKDMKDAKEDFMLWYVSKRRKRLRNRRSREAFGASNQT